MIAQQVQEQHVQSQTLLRLQQQQQEQLGKETSTPARSPLVRQTRFLALITDALTLTDRLTVIQAQNKREALSFAMHHVKLSLYELI